MQTGALLLFDRPLPVERLVTEISKRVGEIPWLKYRLQFAETTDSLPALKADPNFDIANHVRLVPTAATESGSELAAAASDTFKSSLRRYRPLWEIALLVRRNKDCPALVCRMHHCMADGIGAVELLSRLFGGGPQPAEPTFGLRKSRISARLGNHGTDKDRSASAFEGLVLSPRRSLGQFSQLLQSGMTAWERRPLPFNGASSAGRRLGWIEVDGKLLLAIKRSFRCTANDVFLAIVAGGVRELLKTLNQKEVLRSADLKMLIPVSRRRREGLEKSRNAVSAMIVSIPLATANSKRRLAEIAEASREAQASGFARSMTTAIQILGSLPPVFLPLLSMAPFHRAFDVVCTNVPGPERKLAIAGSQVKTMVPIAPLANNMGLSFAGLSCSGNLTIGITADAKLVKNIDPICRGMRTSFADLHRAARAGMR
jgi:diacylglycerol O-acyltransferase